MPPPAAAFARQVVRAACPGGRERAKNLLWAAQQAASSAAVARAQASAPASRLGQLSGLLPRNKVTLESAIQVKLSTRRSGCRSTRAPRMGSPCGTCRWTPPTPGSPDRIAEPGPDGFPLAKFQPGAVAGPGYSPFIRIAGSSVVYNAPIVATGDGPFDVGHHTTPLTAS